MSAAGRKVLSLNGEYGTEVITGAATANTGPYSALIAKGATVLTSLTGNWDTLPSALADGESITGKFTAVTISSGTLYCKLAYDASTKIAASTVT